MQTRLGAVAGLALLAVALASCGGSGGQESTATPSVQTPGPGRNLFGNPGFEGGSGPWYSLKPPDFIVSDLQARSGTHSALLRMQQPVEAEGAQVYYLVQELQPAQFPDVLSGYYRVENWKKGTAKQYIQFVVIAFDVKNLPGGFPNHQIRYPLAGIDAEPFAIRNAEFVFISREQPAQGQWIHFERNIKQDFQQLWGAVPEGFTKLRILFEVRYDDKVPGDGSPEADVFYDDLYIGPPGP